MEKQKERRCEVEGRGGDGEGNDKRGKEGKYRKAEKGEERG